MGSKKNPTERAGAPAEPKKARETKKGVTYIKIDMTPEMNEQFERVEKKLEADSGYGLTRAQIAGRAVKAFLNENDPAGQAKTGD